MKKFLLSAFAMLLALTAGAQSFTVEKSPNPLGVQAPAFGAFKAPAKANLAANQRLVGYFDTDDCDNYVGVPNFTGNNKVAIKLTADDLAPYYGKKIAGVRIPVLDEVVYSTKEFSLFSSPKWFADGFEQLKAIADVGIRQEFVRRKVDLLDYARKKTTQKVNLFEKVQIPGYQDAIRKIKRFMEDEENLSKSSQKIVKSKREAEARAAEEQARKEAAV